MESIFGPVLGIGINGILSKLVSDNINQDFFGQQGEQEWNPGSIKWKERCVKLFMVTNSSLILSFSINQNTSKCSTAMRFFFV